MKATAVSLPPLPRADRYTPPVSPEEGQSLWILFHESVIKMCRAVVWRRMEELTLVGLAGLSG
jgi:hypothetical protein